MGLRKALGIIVVSTQAVIAVDYNMQSHKAGLQPGELSMADYAAIVQKRYQVPQDTQFVTSQLVAEEIRGAGIWGKLSGVGSEITARVGDTEDLAEAAILPEPAGPAPVCIRRGTALSCQ